MAEDIQLRKVTKSKDVWIITTWIYSEEKKINDLHLTINGESCEWLFFQPP